MITAVHHLNRTVVCPGDGGHFKHALDHPTLTVGVDDLAAIVLTDTEARTFLHWVDKYWRAVFEQDLQRLADHEAWGGMLTAPVPLVVFREDLCGMQLSESEQATVALLDQLRAAMRSWRAAEVDTVLISGRDNT